MNHRLNALVKTAIREKLYWQVKLVFLDMYDLWDTNRLYYYAIGQIGPKEMFLSARFITKWNKKKYVKGV